MPMEADFPDPHGVGRLTDAYCVIAEINLNYSQKVGRLTVNVWQNKAAYDAGKPPVTQVAYPISEAGTPPTPENPVGFPGFDQIITTPVPSSVLSGQTVIGTTPIWECEQAITYQVLKSQPQFASATVVP